MSVAALAAHFQKIPWQSPSVVPRIEVDSFSSETHWRAISIGALFSIVFHGATKIGGFFFLFVRDFINVYLKMAGSPNIINISFP